MRKPNYPLLVFLFAWLSVLILRTVGLMDYNAVSLLTVSVITSYIVLFTFGFLIGRKFLVKVTSGRFQFNKLIPDKEQGLTFLYILTIFFAYVCVICMFLKINSLSGTYGISLSLKGLSELRGATMDDNSYELGSSLYGMIASMLFGFPVLCGVLAIVYSPILSKQRKQILWVTFIIGIAASMLTGGRFMAFTFILFYYFTIKISRKEKTANVSFMKRVSLAIAGVLLFWIFSQIFLDRLGVRGISFAIYLLPLCTPRSFTTYLLTTFPSLDTLIALISYFEYYIAHGVNQLNVLLNAPYPSHAPYWGGFEFSTFFLFFKKMGLPVITTEEIVVEIVNPGVYFTHIGALFLDFGYWISALVLLVFGYLSGFSWTRFRLKKSKLSLIYLNVILLSLISFAPIVSLGSVGYFPAILVSYFMLLVFETFVALPLYTPDEQL